MSNLETALALAGAGLHVFPCTGSDGDAGKVPPAGFGWKGESSTDPDKIRRWFMRWPGATVALDLGKNGLFVVDCDTPDFPDQLDGRDWFESVILEAGADSFPFVTSKTPSSGVHYIFRQPDGEPLGNGRGGLPKKKHVAIDVRGAGGYIIAPGATMQDGRAYVLGGSIADVPAVPEWLLRIMRTAPADEAAVAPVPLPAVSALVSFPPSTERVGAYSRAGFDAEIAEVRTAPKGTRNDTLNTSAFKIGTMCAAGWISESEAYSALVAAVAGWADPKKTIDTLKRGLREGMGHPRPALPDESTPNLVAPLMARLDAAAVETPLVEQADGAITDGAGEVVGGLRNGADALTGLVPGVSLLAEGLTGFPPGLVGDLARWIVDTSRRPQPLLALGAALTIVAAAAGQHVLGPTGAGTHLYAVGLAPTGSGKDRPLKACVSALADAGLENLIGGSEFISMPAVINSTVTRPVSLWAMDELGAFLSRVNSKRASGFEASITKMLRTLWSAGHERIMTPEWAGRERQAIFAPCLSIFGVSTPDEFLESVSSADLKNGLLNRLLILPEARYVADRRPAIEDGKLPGRLVSGLRSLRGGTAKNPLADVCAPAMPDGLTPLRLGWEGAAESVWRERIVAPLDALMAGKDGRGDDDAPFFARVAEMTIRVAAIIAAGRGAETVSVADVEWGGELAMRSAKTFLTAYRSHVSASDHSERVEFVEAVIRRERTIARQRLVKLTSKRMDARQLNGVVEQMIEAGQLEKVVITQAGAAHRPGLGYRSIDAAVTSPA